MRPENLSYAVRLERFVAESNASSARLSYIHMIWNLQFTVTDELEMFAQVCPDG